jgi:hypothetical protein
MAFHLFGGVFTLICHHQILVSHFLRKSHESEIIVEDIMGEFINLVGKNLPISSEEFTRAKY